MVIKCYCGYWKINSLNATNMVPQSSVCRAPILYVNVPLNVCTWQYWPLFHCNQAHQEFQQDLPIPAYPTTNNKTQILKSTRIIIVLWDQELRSIRMDGHDGQQDGRQGQTSPKSTVLRLMTSDKKSETWVNMENSNASSDEKMDSTQLNHPGQQLLCVKYRMV